MRRTSALALALALAGWLAATAVPAETGRLNEARFTDYPALASNAELARRMLSPLAAADLEKQLERRGQSLKSRSLDLDKERFALFVPATKPATGYGLLVWISPTEEAQLPPGWASVLERRGVIYVSAFRSSNRESVMERRAPLAVIGAWSLMRRFPVDPARVYVGGWSGGSLTALRVALGYPDLFHGAILNAGADPIGEGEGPPPPPKDLMRQFQERTRIIYVTGDRDRRLGDDGDSIKSLRAWCQFNTDARVMAFTEHALIPAQALDRALETLAEPQHPDAEKLAACRAGIDRELGGRLAEAKALVAAGKRDEARALISRIDKKYGGLAAPESLELLGK